MKQLLTRLYRTDDGLDLAEYAILAALIALVCVAMIINLGNSMNGALNNADTQLRSDGGAEFERRSAEFVAVGYGLLH